MLFYTTPGFSVTIAFSPLSRVVGPRDLGYALSTTVMPLAHPKEMGNSSKGIYFLMSQKYNQHISLPFRLHPVPCLSFSFLLELCITWAASAAHFFTLRCFFLHSGPFHGCCLHVSFIRIIAPFDLSVHVTFHAS